jgi:hypothetical protein
MPTHCTQPQPPRRAARSSRGFALLAATALLTAGGARPAAGHGDGSYPRTVNLDWRNEINAFYDSRYDVLVHSERVLNDQLDSLRMFNPSIQRLAHTTWHVAYDAGPSGYPPIWGPWSADDPKFGFERRYWDLLQNNDWWLYAVDSSGTRYHAAMWTMAWDGNFSTKCRPNAQGKRLCDVYADWLVDNLVSQRHIEGVYWDYCNDGISWLNWYMWGACVDCNDPNSPRTPGTKFKSAFDCDEDGVPDPADSANVWWKAGMNIIMDRLRARLGDSFLLVGNGQHHFLQMNGAMIERFPFILGSLDPYPNPNGYKWQANMLSTQFGYLNAYEKIFFEPRLNIIDANSPALNAFEPDRTPERERYKRYTLGSALLGDGYHGMHGPALACMFWEPEYDLRLGWPTGPATAYPTGGGRTLWVRYFENGEVWVNPTGYTAYEVAGGNPTIPAYDAVIRQTVSFPGESAPGTGMSMGAPRPNPAAGQASVAFVLSAGVPATLQVFDVRGRMVREVWSGIGTGQTQTAVWDGDSDLGYPTPAGIYFVTLFAQGHRVEQRLVKLR